MKLSDAIRKKKKATTKFDKSMLAELNSFLFTPEFDVEFNQRANGCFHPSELYGACRRRLAYEFLQAPRNQIEIDPRLQLIFEVGHGVHYRLQRLARKMSEKNGWDFTAEVRITPQSNHWFIGGSCDGVWESDDDLMGLEIKTINKNDFNALLKPKREHTYQANIYQGTLHLPRMCFWYIAKDNSSMKEYIQPFNQKLFESQMSEVEDILAKLQKGVLPPKIRPDCVDPGCKYNVVCKKGKFGVKDANETTQEQIRTFRAKFLGRTVKSVPVFAR